MQLRNRELLGQFQQRYREVTLTAFAHPQANLKKSMTQENLSNLLYTANEDLARGRQMLGCIMDDVKMISFDEIRTI